MVTKDQALGALTSAYNNYTYGLAALAILPNVDLSRFLTQAIQVNDPHEGETPFDISPLVRTLRDKDARKPMLEEVDKGIRRAAIREIHGIVWWYASHSGQALVLRADPLHDFLFASRNLLSHPPIGEITREAIQFLKGRVAKWRNRRIGASVDAGPRMLRIAVLKLPTPFYPFVGTSTVSVRGF